jgi:hypothetical protein
MAGTSPTMTGRAAFMGSGLGLSGRPGKTVVLTPARAAAAGP